jgi:hypothetical protein
MSPPPQLRAVLIIQIPDCETAQERCKPCSNHPPHPAQNLTIAIVSALLLCLIRQRLAGLSSSLLATLAVVWSDADFHDVHRSEQHDGCQDRVSVLVECRILEVVVVGRDENRKARKADSKDSRERLSALVRETGPEHEAGGVDHGELVDELHGVLEGGVEEEATRPDDQVADEGEQEDAVMGLLEAVGDAAVGEVDEEQVGEGVDDLGGVFGGVVVLLAPVQGRGDGCPVAIVAGWWVGDAGKLEGGHGARGSSGKRRGTGDAVQAQSGMWYDTVQEGRLSLAAAASKTLIRNDLCERAQRRSEGARRIIVGSSGFASPPSSDNNDALCQCRCFSHAAAFNC